jgi:hypothetical protein
MKFSSGQGFDFLVTGTDESNSDELARQLSHWIKDRPAELSSHLKLVILNKVTEPLYSKQFLDEVSITCARFDRSSASC